MYRLLPLTMAFTLSGCDLLAELNLKTEITGTIQVDGEMPSNLDFEVYGIIENTDAFDIEYCFDVYDNGSAEVIADCYGRIITRLLKNPKSVGDVEINGNSFVLKDVEADVAYVVIATGSDNTMTCTSDIAGFDTNRKVVTKESAITLSLEGGLEAFQLNAPLQIHCEAPPTEPEPPAPDLTVAPEFPEPEVEDEVLNDEGDLAEPLVPGWSSFTVTDKYGEEIYADASMGADVSSIDCNDGFPSVLEVRGTAIEATDTAYIRIQFGTGDEAVLQTIETRIVEGEIQQALSLTGGFAMIQLDTNDKLDGVGESHPAMFCRPDAPPAQELLVLMSWDSDDTDIDLHVVGDDGTEVAYYSMNQTWGDLDIDDIDGFGPETFSSTPEASDRYYRVAGHYYSDHGNGPTTVTVRVIYHDPSTGEVCDVTASNEMNVYDWWGAATFGPGLPCPEGDGSTTGSTTDM
jgi:hypothetical protein